MGRIEFVAKERERRKMSGMGDGYVGTSQDGVRIRRLQKQREAERRKIQELKSKTASGQEQSGLLQFGSSSCEVVPSFFSFPISKLIICFYSFFPMVGRLLQELN